MFNVALPRQALKKRSTKKNTLNKQVIGVGTTQKINVFPMMPTLPSCLTLHCDARPRWMTETNDKRIAEDAYLLVAFNAALCYKAYTSDRYKWSTGGRFAVALKGVLSHLPMWWIKMQTVYLWKKMPTMPFLLTLYCVAMCGYNIDTNNILLEEDAEVAVVIHIALRCEASRKDKHKWYTSKRRWRRCWRVTASPGPTEKTDRNGILVAEGSDNAVGLSGGLRHLPIQMTKMQRYTSERRCRRCRTF